MNTVTIEHSSPKLAALAAHLESRDPLDRRMVSLIARRMGFATHVGGHHVAVLHRSKRVALVTGSHPDFQ